MWVSVVMVFFLTFQVISFGWDFSFRFISIVNFASVSVLSICRFYKVSLTIFLKLVVWCARMCIKGVERKKWKTTTMIITSTCSFARLLCDISSVVASMNRNSCPNFCKPVTLWTLARYMCNLIIINLSQSETSSRLERKVRPFSTDGLNHD